MTLWVIRQSVIAFLMLMPCAVMAQSPSPAATSNEQLLKSDALDALVAPVALYPDTLLAEVLMASTYPLEVVQAERWASENKTLKGDQLKTAVDKQQWDDSVKALVATPSVLTMMSTKLDWTQKLGDAVLAQQADVMDAIQRLRSKAQANNKLTSTKEQKVTVGQEQNKQYIAIEPTNPDTIYVPYYDPAVVYGAWPYPAYPPYYFPPPAYLYSGIIATGIAFGTAYALARWAFGGNYWGGGMNWGNNNITVNRPVTINNIGNNWQHRPEHRQGVRYTNKDVQQRFGNNNIRAGSQDRLDFRGRGGEQVLRPGGDRSNLGNRVAERPSAGNPIAGSKPGANRPSAGNRPSNRPSAGNRPANRPSAGNRPANRPSAGNRPENRPSAGNRPATRPSAGVSRPSRDNVFGNISSGRAANLQSARGQASLGGRGGGGGIRPGGAGSFGGGGGRGGGGRRSDAALKHDIALLGRLDNGLGFYRFSYVGSDKSYVGVIAQEVQMVMPEAVVRDRDGYLRVFYDKLGVKFQTYERWVATGARVPR